MSSTAAVLAPRQQIAQPPLGPAGFPFLPDDRLHHFNGELHLHFSAMYEAEDWLRDCGYIVGPCQGGNPRGVLHSARWRIAKWSTLSLADRARLDGVMLAPGDADSMRHGPITVRIRAAQAPIEEAVS